MMPGSEYSRVSQENEHSDDRAENRRGGNIISTNNFKSCLRNNKKKIIAFIVIALMAIAIVLAVTFSQSHTIPTSAPIVSPTSASTSVAATTAPTTQTAAPTPSKASTRETIITTQIADCLPLNLSQNLRASCSDDRRVDSMCTFSCVAGYQLEGPSMIFCKTSREWSANPPTCKNSSCPPCFTGPYCKETTSWKKVELQVIDAPYVVSEVTYASFEIKCRATASLHKFQVKFDCECTDQTTKASAKCKKYSSPATSCKNALARLIRILVKLKDYPKSCDDKDMPTIC